MHASDHGTSLRVLQRAIACPRFPIAVSVGHDCLQLLRVCLQLLVIGFVILTSLLLGL